MKIKSRRYHIFLVALSLLFVGCGPSEQEPSPAELRVSVTCLPQSPAPGESSTIEVRVTRGAHPARRETVYLSVSAVLTGTETSESLAEQVGQFDTPMLTTDEQGVAKAEFVAGPKVERAALTARILPSGGWDSCVVEAPAEERESEAKLPVRLSLACEPLGGVPDLQEEGQVTLQVSGHKGQPVAGEKVQVSVYRGRQTERGTPNERLRPPSRGSGDIIRSGKPRGVLGRLHEALEGEPAETRHLVTSEQGRAEMTYRMPLSVQMIRVEVAGQQAFCLWQ